MRKLVRVVYKDKVEEREFKSRNRSHLDSQIKYPHRVEQPKKGKGSYKRTNKYNKLEV